MTGRTGARSLAEDTWGHLVEAGFPEKARGRKGEIQGKTPFSSCQIIPLLTADEIKSGCSSGACLYLYISNT